MMIMKELVVCGGRGGYVDTLKVGRLIKTHICILTVRAGNTLFRATVSITCGSYFKIVTRLAKWSQE